ncbi:AMP-binding protein [Cupriavidus nantongensis]|uniref:Long-chain fatty acid--CoA ligase n=1 Tax=Cupriavidus nantongensis TaxID=1796606 RepID=A0A142JRJ7_9BURK|nr:AMP-binding protein [Cupriavidus nantongensis]AMR80709.1 long-chain fatty acid--CoA ligase [Cupriavidus nantongensis]
MTRLADPALSYIAPDTSVPVLDMTTGDALRAAALRHPHRTALVEVAAPGQPSLTGAASTARRWTYDELMRDAERCARWLLTRFEPGERVCLWAPNVPEWVILQYGAALAGLVLVTANPGLRAAELRYVLTQSQASGLLHTAEFRGTNMSAIAGEVADCVRERFCLSDWHGEVLTCSSTAELPTVLPTDPAQIQYTSGTTGQPKGALLHHRGLVTNAAYVAARAGMNGSILMSPMPLFHTAGAVLSSLGAITTGSTYVLPLMFEPELVLTAIARERCEFLFGVPTMLIAMLEHPRRGDVDLRSLKVASSGGAPVPPELLRRIEREFGCDLITVYGQTEASPIICQSSPADSQEDKANTAGYPLPQVEVRIADPADGAIVATGQEGEIQARGYQCMLGYFNMPEATAAAVSADGWLRTGDLGTMDERGYLRVTGRLKDMIIRGGENIYPAEVEARLIEHPAVAMAAVFGLPDEKWGEVVAVAIRLREGGKPEPDALRDFLRLQLAPHKIPTRWFCCSEFPMTGSGKIQKFRLRELAEAGGLAEFGL